VEAPYPLYGIESSSQHHHEFHVIFTQRTYLFLLQVTYLDGAEGGSDGAGVAWGGSPLVVFDTSSRDPRDPALLGSLKPRRLAPGPARSWVCFPIPGNHVCFAGDLLHGVPADLLPLMWTEIETETGGSEKNKDIATDATTEPIVDEDCTSNYCRVSLPVNVWYSRPQATHRLPEHFFQAHNKSFGAVRSSTDNKSRGSACCGAVGKDMFKRCNSGGVQCETLVEVSAADIMQDTAASGEAALHFLREHVDGDTAPLPAARLRKVWNKARRNSKSSSTPGGGGGSCAAGLAINYIC
jgi:hypothetical protein